MSTEPTKESVAKEFAGWHLWVGISGLKYARKLDVVPPVVVRGREWADVREQIMAKLTPQP
jgi:hypothetical protein